MILATVILTPHSPLHIIGNNNFRRIPGFLWHHQIEKMSFRATHWHTSLAFAAALAIFVSPAYLAQTVAGVSDPPQRISIASLPNAAEVTPNLYRGAQPDPSGYAQLKNLGIEVIVDFREEKSEIKDEQAHVEAAGMRFISIPWSPLNNPSRAQIISFFGVLRDNPQKKIFVHCEAGSDRTGVMIALYRIELDHWTTEQALAEMKLFRFHNVLYAHLAQFVRAFPAAVSGDPALLAGFAPATAALPKQ
jgi:tyrosine-protein phosphatase SIW14